MSRSLQQKVIDATINECRETECRCASRWKTFLTLIVSFLSIWKSHWQMMCDLCRLFPTRCSFMPEFVIFRILLSQGKVCTLSRWGGKIKATFRWHIYSVILVPKFIAIGQQLLKLLLVIGWYTFLETRCIYTMNHERTILLSNVDWFLKLFHQQTKQ